MMLEEMQALAREKNSCVLATIVDTKPYCSLMAYVVPERKPPSLTFASGRRAKQSYKLNFLLEFAGKSQAENRSAL